MKLADVGRALCFAAIVAAVISLEARQDRFVLAAMRRDGVMVPFAAFDGGKWVAPWPATVRLIDLPASLDDVPAAWWGGERPASWKLWPIDGPSRALSPSSPLIVHIGRARRLGVRSDHPAGPPVGPFQLPYPKDGLVIGGSASLEPIMSVSRHVPQWRQLPVALRADIERAEQKAVDGVKRNANWAHPVSALERGGVVAELEAWYTTSLAQPGFSVSYIEAVKRYPPGPEDEGCGLETFIRGWVHQNDRTPVKTTELTAKITYCDREGASYLLPFGRLTVQGRTHWVVQLSGWDHEWYSVVRFEPQRVRYVVEYPAGSPFPG